MSGGSERRRDRRYPVNITVRWRLADENEWNDAIFLTAGTNGAFLKTDTKIATGARIELDVPVDDRSERIDAEVMWLSDTPPCGLGLRYIELEDNLQERILDDILEGRWLRG